MSSPPLKWAKSCRRLGLDSLPSLQPAGVSTFAPAAPKIVAGYSGYSVTGGAGTSQDGLPTLSQSKISVQRSQSRVQ